VLRDTEGVCTRWERVPRGRKGPMSNDQGPRNIQCPKPMGNVGVPLRVGCGVLGKQSRGRMDWGAPSELGIFWAVVLGLRSQGSLQPRLLYGGPSGLQGLGKSRTRTRTTTRTNSDGKLQGGRFCWFGGWKANGGEEIGLRNAW
jgi:hypothetical protein